MSLQFCVLVVEKKKLHQKRLLVALTLRRCWRTGTASRTSWTFEGEVSCVIYSFSCTPVVAKRDSIILLYLSSRWGGVAASLHFPMSYFKTTPRSRRLNLQPAQWTVPPLTPPSGTSAEWHCIFSILLRSESSWLAGGLVAAWLTSHRQKR